MGCLGPWLGGKHRLPRGSSAAERPPSRNRSRPHAHARLARPRSDGRIWPRDSRRPVRADRAIIARTAPQRSSMSKQRIVVQRGPPCHSGARCRGGVRTGRCGGGERLPPPGGGAVARGAGRAAGPGSRASCSQCRPAAPAVCSPAAAARRRRPSSESGSAAVLCARGWRRCVRGAPRLRRRAALQRRKRMLCPIRRGGRRLARRGSRRRARHERRGAPVAHPRCCGTLLLTLLP